MKGTTEDMKSPLLIKLEPREHRLAVVEYGHETLSFPIATARYNVIPKYWSNDYRNPSGTYSVTAVFPAGTSELESLNSSYVPWYLSPTARDPFEDAGLGLYGTGMIVLDYPNEEDWERYLKARESGLLRHIWNRFCQHHLRPIYDVVSRQQGVAFAETVVKTDYGAKTFDDVLESCPILDPQVAFSLGVAIHGSNDPECIGTSISAGCIRMHNQHIEQLLEKVVVGNPVVFEPTTFLSL